jgi:hypothetical protein
MQSTAILATNDHLESLRADAARRRAPRASGRSLRARLATGLAGLSAMLETAAASAPNRQPRIQGYPFQI